MFKITTQCMLGEVAQYTMRVPRVLTQTDSARVVPGQSPSFAHIHCTLPWKPFASASWHSMADLAAHIQAWTSFSLVSVRVPVFDYLPEAF